LAKEKKKSEKKSLTQNKKNTKPSVLKSKPVKKTMVKKSASKENKITGPHFIKNLGKTKVIVLGTAHISPESVRDVQVSFLKDKPDLVCVELCDARYKSIVDKNRWQKLDIVQVIKQKKMYLLMSNLILSSFQKKIGETTKVKPGEEILTGIALAQKNNIPFALVDRDVQITLRRAWQSTGYFSKVFLISELAASLIVSPETSAEQIEEMKSKDILEGLFENLPARYNKIKQILITERDKYLSQKIKDAVKEYPKSKTALAIVGAGHLAGIKKYLDKEIDIKPLEYVQPKSKFWAALKFFTPIFIIMFLFYFFSNTNSTEDILKNILAWTVIKSACAGFFTLVLWAHPLSILAAAATAPISNFNPVLKPGWVAALIEAKFHKPTVSDFENITEDTSHFKTFFKNKVIKIFGVFFLPQLGSSIGTGLALWYIANF